MTTETKKKIEELEAQLSSVQNELNKLRSVPESTAKSVRILYESKEGVRFSCGDYIVHSTSGKKNNFIWYLDGERVDDFRSDIITESIYCRLKQHQGNIGMKVLYSNPSNSITIVLYKNKEFIRFFNKLYSPISQYLWLECSCSEKSTSHFTVSGADADFLENLYAKLDYRIVG